MGIGYQSVDRHIIDYDLWFHPRMKYAFRGPRRDFRVEGAICCIGAAQTFGRFVERPFAAQLDALLDQPVLNLGLSGAGPEVYLGTPFLLQTLARADTVVVQSMSARSVSAGIFETQANKGALAFRDGPLAGKVMKAQRAYHALAETYGRDAFIEQVRAAQARWLELHEELAARIPGRKIFLWLSAAEPGQNINLEEQKLGQFPHFVDAPMVDRIVDMGFELVKAVLPDMPAQVLVNDRTGLVEQAFDPDSFPSRSNKQRALNPYYATPELHDLATRRLLPVLLRSKASGARPPSAD